MPKLGFPESHLTNTLKQVRFPDRQSVTALAEEQGIPYLGSGQYCIVTEGHFPGTVDAINYNPFPQLHGLRLLYSQQILHLMFPNNFPDFYAVYWKNFNGQKEHTFAGTSRQLIVGKQLQTSQEVEELLYPDSPPIQTDPKIRPYFPLWQVEDILKTIDPNLWFDRNPNNFFITPSGQQIYADTLPFVNRRPIHNPQLFTNIINKYDMGEIVRQKVLAKLARLQKVFPLIEF